MILASSSILTTLLTGFIMLFSTLICNPERASKRKRVRFRYNIWVESASQKMSISSAYSRCETVTEARAGTYTETLSPLLMPGLFYHFAQNLHCYNKQKGREGTPLSDSSLRTEKAHWSSVNNEWVFHS